MEKRYLNRDEAAKFLNLRPQTLANFAWRGEGPPVIRISARCVRYQVEDLINWMKAHREGPEPLKEVGKVKDQADSDSNLLG